MTHRADPRLLGELKKYGALDVAACFNCGNCTAVCPLSTGEESFPRRMIRFAQLGMRDRLLSSRELWMCYYCGECTATCPRQADPGELMAAARRYAIASYDRFGLARILYTSPTLSALFLLVLAAGLGMFLYSFHGPMPAGAVELFTFMPSNVIHNLGVAAGILIIALALSGIFNMVVQVGRQAGLARGIRFGWLAALWATLAEVLGQARYRRECETYATPQPWYAQKWLVHASILWGFLGLFAATALDYMLELVGVKPTGTWVPIWYPVRLLGTLAGILMVYGVTMAIVRRWRKSDESTAHSTPSDWVFLILLWLAGITGFALEVSIYLPPPQGWGYWMLLAHLVVVGELLILLPFTKFAHAVYRTAALYLHFLKPIPTPAEAGVGATE